jgi:putative oxidoreductase
MNIALWILQILLATLFLWHGWLFVAPPAAVLEVMNAQFAPWFRIFVGVAETLAAVGLILPSLTRVQPWLTPLAATGLALVTMSATTLHLTRGEITTAMTTVVLFSLASIVAYGRWKLKPIPARGLERHVLENATP